jgi:hypothetical protein
MTADQLREFKHRLPFKPFTIHMSDGRKFEVADPENLVLPRDWNTDAIVAFPRGRFAFVYIRNVTSVESQGRWPNVKKRRKRGSNGDHGGSAE